MEQTIAKIITIAAYVGVFAYPVFIIILLWLHHRYKGTLQESLDILNEKKIDYTGIIPRMIVLFFISFLWIICS